MRVYFVLLLGIIFYSVGCSDPSGDIPESGHTALGTSAPPAINPVRTDSLQYLTQYIGKQPDSVDLWKTEPLKSKLEDLLESDLPQFLHLMQGAMPLQKERVLYTISSPNERNATAILLIDIDTNEMHVSIIEKGIRKQYQTPGEELYVPYEVERRL